MGSRGRLGHWLPSVLLACHIFFLVVLGTGGEVYIIKGPENQRVRAGMAVTFTCTAGTDTLLNGVPTIDWQKDDERIIFSKDRRFSVDRSENSLTLKNTSTSDTGLYSCVAKQGRNREKVGAQLIVEDVPDAPIGVVLSQCQDRIAQLQWRLIGENYSPVHQFIIQYNTSFDSSHWHVAKTQLPRDRHYQRIALSPWGNYSFRVIAQNAIGESPPSKPTAKMCHTQPDVPHLNPKGVCTMNEHPHSLTIHWEAMPLEEQNAPGFYYLVKWRKHGQKGNGAFQERVVEVTSNQLTVNDQPIFQEYEIYVLAVNQVGEAVAPPQMKIGYSAEEEPEMIPQNFRLDVDKDVTDTTANFMWDEVNTGPWMMKGLFKGYKIQYWKTDIGITTMKNHTIVRNDPDECFCSRRPATRWKRHEVDKTEVYNLWPYTNITAQIRVLNAKYEGKPSKKITFMTAEGVPGPVSNFAIVRRGSHSLDLHWQKPQAANGVLLGYTISFKVVSTGEYHASQRIDLGDPEVTTMKLDNLMSERTYRATIWARTKMGGGQSYDAEGTTLPSGPPVAPSFTTASISKRAINITWFPSVHSANPGRIFDVLYRKTGDLDWETEHVPDNRHWLVIEGLQPGVHYEMRVLARNSDEHGSPETSSPIQTVVIGLKRDLPEPTFKVSYVDQTSFCVSLVKFDSEVKTFFVQYRLAGNLQWHSTDDHKTTTWATVAGLQAGRAYQLRVITKSYYGQSRSSTQQVIAGTDPDAQASVGSKDIISSGSRTFAPFVCPVFMIVVCFFWSFLNLCL